MERLTGKNNDYCFTVCGGERKHIREDCNIYKVCFERQIYERLKHYEDLAEAGRLVELPCAVGDTVYGIFCDKVYPKRITRIEINPHTNPKLWIGTKFDFSSGTIDRIDMVLGKTVFLTREEAEAALKGENE